MQPPTYCEQYVYVFLTLASMKILHLRDFFCKSYRHQCLIFLIKNDLGNTYCIVSIHSGRVWIDLSTGTMNHVFHNNLKQNKNLSWIWQFSRDEAINYNSIDSVFQACQMMNMTFLPLNTVHVVTLCSKYFLLFSLFI